LREGIDLPEVSLLMILDADKEGFLRSERSLIQIIGRCARNSNGRVILYADEVTDSMMGAVSETNRRRAIQEKYNEENGIVPKTVIKHVKNVFETVDDARKKDKIKKLDVKKLIDTSDPGKLSSEDREKLISTLTTEMKKAAKDLDFEKAAELRDVIIGLKNKAD
jgi:excinuclease ABC subunit B